VSLKLNRIEIWAKANNQTLISDKTAELKRKGIRSFQPPPSTLRISRVDEINVLGVILDKCFSFIPKSTRL
jgi:hypothetical protein